MVRSRIDRRDLVKAGGQASSHISRQLSILGRAVQAFEERKLLWICRCRLIKRGELLNHDMRVALDLALPIQLLGCGKIVLICVYEETSRHVLDCHLHGEVRVGFDGAQVRGKDKLSRRHIINGWDQTHGGGVTRACSDLLPVRDRRT